MITRRELLVQGATALALAALPLPVFAGEENKLSLLGHPVQGGLVMGQAPSGSKAWVGKDAVRISRGLFCFGFGRDDVKPVSVKIEYPDGSIGTQVVTPGKRTFDIQRINGLDEKYVSPPKDVLDRIARDNRAVGAARAFNTDKIWFANEFDWPADGPLTGFYGSQRILNGEPRAPHYGVDIAAPEGSPVKAPMNGIVRMAEELYLSGNTIILDHGHGVSTSYLHMSRLDVKPGDELDRGQQMGLVGHTGRATGPHVCWRLNCLQTRLDVSLIARARA